MGRVIVIEGLDGSGKRTLARTLATGWRAVGHSVATLAFPRYGIDVHADLVRDALYGRLGDLGRSVHGPALLFALDRAGAAETVRELRDTHDVVLLDRYIASNAAYGAARLGGPDMPTDFPEWVRALEVDRFGAPLPDLQVLLDTPVELAAQRARDRAAGDSSRALDGFESDAALQGRTAAMYAQLAGAGYLSPWVVLRPDAEGGVTPPASLLAGAAGPE